MKRPGILRNGHNARAFEYDSLALCLAQYSQQRAPTAPGLGSPSELTAYVAERIKKLRPTKKDALLNSIDAMFQFQGGISEQDRDKVVAELQKKRHITMNGNNRVAYPEQA